MKSRLESASHTGNDVRVWCRVWADLENGEAWRALVRISAESDQRDAYIMLFLESAKANGCHDTLTRMGQIHGFIGSFVRLPGIPARDEDYA